MSRMIPCVMTGQEDTYSGPTETKEEKQLVVGNDELISGYKFDMSTGYNLKVVLVLRVMPFQMLEKLL